MADLVDFPASNKKREGLLDKVNPEIVPEIEEEYRRRRRHFFALVNKLGFDSEDAKERAKERFGVESFNDLTLKQLNILIGKLKARQEIKKYR